MRNLLPVTSKGPKKEMYLGDILSPKPPLVPFPEVLELVKKYDNFSTPLPRLEVLGASSWLNVIKLDTREFNQENWFNYLAMKVMQVSVVPVQLVEYNLILAPSFVWRDATYKANARIQDLIEQHTVKLLGQLPPREEGDEEDLFPEEPAYDADEDDYGDDEPEEAEEPRD